MNLHTLLQILFEPQIWSQSFAIHALISGTIVAVISGLTGFFIVLQDSAFVAHALPRIGFAGAAGAVLVGTSPFLGLTLFSLGGALSVGWMGSRGRQDVATALTLVFAMGLGALFLVLSSSYAGNAYALLFGQITGISLTQVIQTLITGAASVLLLLMIARPLTLVSLAPDLARSRHLPILTVQMLYLVVIGLVTAATVPVVGALLSFSLLVGPAATAKHLTRGPAKVVAVSVLLAVLTMWLSLLLGFDTGWPVSFFVASVTAVGYTVARVKSRVG